MRRGSILASVALACGLLAGCFSGDNSTTPGHDAGGSSTDGSVTVDSGGHDAGVVDSTVPDTGVDAAPEAGVDAPPETGEAGVDATADVGVDAAEAGVDAGVDAPPEAAAACKVATDCPADTSCNTATGQCGVACGGAQHTACNGGCCDPTAGQCVAGTSPTACGNTGAACTGCAGNATGTACVAGACGCSVPTDCALDRACDTTTHACGTACGAANDTACNGGCCDPLKGQCTGGNVNTACGNTGAACTACANATPTCGGGACTASCGQPGNGTCGGGTCCSPSSSLCQVQGSSLGCGTGCVDCTGNASGSACIAGGTRCGCTVATDCPLYHTCDVSKNTCVTNCGQAGLTACNGGCCPPATAAAPVCAPGTSNTACGLSGGACVNCSSLNKTCGTTGVCQ